ncbi:MAG: hypothetical protein KJ558_00740 [Gammaproteobacteria bacterium]|nr:hypothetical protein [Gammaproteobacteria bacterium]MBU1653362.1 hypothetical protein [Gammaproteobacteria bacterium]MBU1962789.1 hypothetical protein [Gammaproteobacteria bacterium]
MEKTKSLSSSSKLQPAADLVCRTRAVRPFLPASRAEIINHLIRLARKGQVSLKAIRLYCQGEAEGEISCMVETSDGEADRLASAINAVLIGEKRNNRFVCGWRTSPTFECDRSFGSPIKGGCTCGRAFRKRRGI